MKTKNLLINLKDYNNELEKVLETKDFSENVKNLLLSMLYKIETSYSDYQKIKRIVPEKWEIVEEIINDINLNCKEIELIKPKTKKDISKENIVINKDVKKILVYQNEKMMLDSIYQISSKNMKVNNKYYVYADALEDFFKKASLIDKMEIIRDFDGWTWYRVKSEIDKFYYNLLYQNLTILLGCKSIKKVIENTNPKFDVVEFIDINLKKIYGREIGETLLEKIKLSTAQIYFEEKINKIEEKCGKLQLEKQKYVNKSKMIDDISTNRKQKLKRIMKIDDILSDRDLLEKEFLERNENGETIFSINTLVLIMKKEKEKILQEIDEMGNTMNPKNITHNESEIDRRISILEEIQKNNLNKNIIDVQKLFIKCLDAKLKNANTKKDIIDLMAITRYYNLLEFSERRVISQVKEINAELKSFQDKLIIKAFELKAINKIFADKEFNLKIMEDILKLKIIDMENIEIIIQKDGNGYKLKIYDGESLEYQADVDKIQMQGIKTDKKIKVFN